MEIWKQNQTFKNYENSELSLPEELYYGFLSICMWCKLKHVIPTHLLTASEQMVVKNPGLLCCILFFSSSVSVWSKSCFPHIVRMLPWQHIYSSPSRTWVLQWWAVHLSSRCPWEVRWCYRHFRISVWEHKPFFFFPLSTALSHCLISLPLFNFSSKVSDWLNLKMGPC